MPRASKPNSPSPMETRSSSARHASSPQTLTLRRSTRETRGNKSKLSTPSPPPKPSSVAKKPLKPSASTDKQHPKRRATNSAPHALANNTAKRKITDSADTNADDASTTLLKKPNKRLNRKTYLALFETSSEDKADPPALATPLRVDDESAFMVHVEDSTTVLSHEEVDAQEQDNQACATEVASKYLQGTSGLHKVPEVVVETDVSKNKVDEPAPTSEPCMPDEMCSHNNASESSPAMQGGEQTVGCSNPSSVTELPNRPCPTVPHKEVANKTIDDGDSGEILGASTSSQAAIIQSVETDYNEYTSCDGKGCKSWYHDSCLDPPLQYLPLGIWLCTTCTKKRLQFGLYAVSEGIESLWDVKEGSQNSKQYFVKYKNLAHVHNQWVPESDIICTPGGHDLITKFCKRIQKEKTIRWKQEWTEPHRLLKKRSLMSQKEAEEFFNSLGDKFSYCNVEWLVKWKDLGYEHATWELESSSFLCTPEAKDLKKNYESRHEDARRGSDPAKIKKVKQSPLQKLQRLPDGLPPGLDKDHLSSLNRLREFWHNSDGAIFLDDQERVIKTILFAMSILPDVCQPLLIVSTSTSLSLWEAKFNRLTQFINVVVYNGEKDVRKQIQDLEFYENGSVMFQVLLSHPDAILEVDIQTMECIVWEAVIVDDCQSLRVSKCLEQLKHLSTNFRMVLLSSPLKESIPEYINVLSFLNPEGDVISSSSNGHSIDTVGDLATLKEKFARHVAFERKADSPKFLEYWVPARLSRVQLEMYCSTLLSNSPALRSHSRTDNVGVLRDILVSLRKCCDHPYLVDQSLQSSLTKGHPLTDILDIGVRASGKLLLLDKMLQEIRNQGLRSGGGAGNPMGDILDDFVRQRFGFESYERVERGLLVPKKQTALNMFNDRTKGRFIFLIDSRACVPSIKLSSVDAIIIYCSDWNPTNDLRVLQRISIESQSECVPIFRLYSSCTVEEKTLILAKHDHTLDSNIQNVMPIVSHSLLSWGASFLFHRLEEFQKHGYSSKDSEGDDLFMSNAFLEFVVKLSTKVEASTKMDNAVIISRAHQSGSFYSRDITVISEREGISAVDGDLPKFWTFWSNLLGGRSPHWQYITEPVQRNRRKIQNMEDQMIIPAEETDEVILKRRKIGEITDSSPKVIPVKDKDALLPENNTTLSTHETSVEDTWQELGEESLQGTQKGLHTQLKSELSKLYELLELPEAVRCLCEELLDYILKNHQVSQGPKGILHAFNIALCWRAASLLKHKINRRESLALAVRNLNYECDEKQAEYVYEKLRILKKKFTRRASETSKQSQFTPVNNTSTYQQQTSPMLRSDGSIPKKVATLDGDLEDVSHQEAPHDYVNEMVLEQKELISALETHREEHVSRDELLKRTTEKKIHLIHMVFSLREKNIHSKQENETSQLDMHKQKEVEKLRETCTLVVKHLRKSHDDSEDRDRMVKLLIDWFTLLLYAFLDHMSRQRDKLKMQQSIAWNKELQLKEKFLKEAKSGHLDDTFDQQIPLPDSCFTLEEFSHFKEVVGNFPVGADTSANCQQPLASAMEITLVRSTIPSENVNSEAAMNGAAEVSVHTERRPTSEVGLSQDRMENSSDGIDPQGGSPLAVQHSLSSNPAIEDSMESSVGSHRSKHIGDVAVEVNADNSETTPSGPPHLEAPTVAALPSNGALPVAREVQIQTDPVIQSAQQNIVTGQVPQEDQPEGSTVVTSVQPLQPEMRPSSSVSSILLGRTHSDQSRESHQPEAPPSSVDPTQLFPVASMMFNHPPVGNEPLKNELHRLQLHIDSLNKIYELKKSELQTQCSQEIEKIKHKYGLLIKEQESIHHHHRKTLNNLYGKVLLNQSLADDFRLKFVSSAARARSVSPPNRQAAVVSQQLPARPSLSGSIASPAGSSSAGRPPLQRHCAEPSQVDRSPSSEGCHSSSSSSQVVRSPPAMLGNVVRAASAPFSQTPTAHGNYGVRSELARAPAPHLQFRLSRAHPTASANQEQQQQLPIILEGISSRTQSSPVSTPVNARQLSSQAVSPVNNSSLSSSQPLLSSVSSSVPALAANSSSNTVLAAAAVPSPPSSHPLESVTSAQVADRKAVEASTQPSTTNSQVIMAGPNAAGAAASGLNTVAAVSSGLSAAAAASRSMQQQHADSDSVSLDAWLTSNLGGVDVVCLSDDDEPEQ
uniref:Chromo domain-containing protein n=1 Tax=Leersia perrieri TaxID=77586 RepID=A0A0D9WKR2_9ORYZ